MMTKGICRTRHTERTNEHRRRRRRRTRKLCMSGSNSNAVRRSSKGSKERGKEKEGKIEKERDLSTRPHCASWIFLTKQEQQTHATTTTITRETATVSESNHRGHQRRSSHFDFVVDEIEREKRKDRNERTNEHLPSRRRPILFV